MLYGGPVAEAAWQRVFAEARNLDSWARSLRAHVSVRAKLLPHGSQLGLTRAARWPLVGRTYGTAAL